MTIADEDQWIGEEMHLVPQLDPDNECNGKTPKRDDDGGKIRNEDNHVLFGGYCSNPAGSGTDDSEGRCKYHGGSNPGAPAHNQNAQTKATTVDPHHYHENLPLVEQEWIQDTTESILDRVRRNHGREPDFLDKTLARSVAINFHILSKARDYSKDELVQVIVHENDTIEEKGALVEEVRRFQNSIFENLNKLGVMDSPEQQQADAMGDWRQFIESGNGGQSQSDTPIVIDAEDKEKEE